MLHVAPLPGSTAACATTQWTNTCMYMRVCHKLWPDVTNCGVMSQTAGDTICNKLCGDVTNYGKLQQTVERCCKNTGRHHKPWADVTYAGVCWGDATNRGQMSQKYKMSQTVKRCQKLWEGVTLWTDVKKKYSEMSQTVGRCHKLQRCHKLRGYVTNYREMSQTVGR